MRWVWVACLSVCLSVAMACSEPDADGEPGPQGEPGAEGEQGPPGMDPSADEVAGRLADSVSFREQLAELIKGDPAFVESLRGEAGSEGQAGPQGEQGPQGEAYVISIGHPLSYAAREAGMHLRRQQSTRRLIMHH